MLSVFYFVFTNLFKNPIENYPLYLLSGLILWYMFSRGTNAGMNSLVSRSTLIERIYFRRELLVVSSTLTTFLMLFFELLVFFGFMAVFGVIPNWYIILLPLVLLNLYALTLGISFILSSFNVYFKDIQHIWPIVLLAGFFVIPLFYQLDTLPENLQSILRINPLVGILEITRALVINTEIPSTEYIGYTVLSSATILVVGYLIFRKLDHNLVEKL